MDSTFAQGDLGFERYPSKKKTKKIQKDLYRQSVHTDALQSFDGTTDPFKGNVSLKKKNKKVMFNICNCSDDQLYQNNKIKKYKPKGWESITNMYGDNDTTEVWIDAKNRIAKVHKGKYKTKQHNNDIDENKDGDYKSRKRGKSNLGTQNNDQNNNRNNISLNPNQNVNVSSVISLFRNNNNKHKTTNGKLKFEKKSKQKRDLQTNYKNTLSTDHKTEQSELKCSKGPCVEAKKENKRFLCSCAAKKEKPELFAKECTNVTCKLSKNSISFHSAAKIKEKILCLCHKYSQKIINLKSFSNTCNEGMCFQARKRHEYDFTCKCKENDIIKCSESTCGKYTKVNINAIALEKTDQATPRSNLQSLQKQKRSNNRHNKDIIQLEHESEQTGEPFFEVQVNPRDMCVLNPKEIRENIIKFGKREKQQLKCICPSRGRIRVGDICPSGVCKKAYKNKQTNFNCWCEKKIAECGDITCDVQGFKNKNAKQHRNNNKISKSHILNKPLLEVQLDMDKMCVVNPKEIEDKIINNISVDDTCSSGICREALKNKAPYFCKCISRKMTSEITECKEDTCIDSTKRRSKLCLFCTRICSRSENWSTRKKSYSQNRTKRSSFYNLSPNKICRGKICSKSDNLRKNNLHVSNMKHLPACNCKECKENSSLFYAQKEIPTNNSYNVEVTTKNNNKYKPDNNNRTVNNGELRLHKNNNLQEKELVALTKVKNKNKLSKTDKTAHACECHVYDDKRDSEHLKENEKSKNKKLAQRRRNKKYSQRQALKDMKRRAKLEKKKEKEAAKLRMKEIQEMRKKMEEEPLDTNFCTAFFLGIIKIVLRSFVFVFYIIFTIIRDPKGSFWYVRDRIADPEGTYNKLRKWLSDALMIKKLQIAETVRGSDTLTILADHFLDTSLYQSFADKGKTKKDQIEFERKSKARKRRIRKREQQAISSCRHMLLTTLRHTPCLWVYHICPNFYPQCLSLLAFLRNFGNIMMFLVAFICWTPCIVSFELCRAVLCCFMCTN